MNPVEWLLYAASVKLLYFPSTWRLVPIHVTQAALVIETEGRARMISECLTEERARVCA